MLLFYATVQRVQSSYAVAALLLLQQLRTNWISGFWILDLAFGGLGLGGLRLGKKLKHGK